MNRVADAAERAPTPVAGRATASRWAERRPPFSLVRLAIMSVVAISFSELVSMVVLELTNVSPYWVATLADLTIMNLLALPPLHILVYRPFARLLEEHRRAGEELERRTRRLEALYAVTSAATRDLDVERLLARVLDVLIPAFEADAGWMQFVDAGPSEESRLVAARGLPDAIVRSAEHELQHACATCGAWRRDPAARRGPAIARCESQPGGALRAEGFTQHGSVLLPIGETSGAILNLLWRSPHPWSDAEASLLEAISQQVEIAVKNAALFQAEQRLRRQAETQRSAGLAIGQSLDLDAVIAALGEHLSRLVPFDRAKVMLLETGSRLRVRAVLGPSGKADPSATGLDSFDIEKNPAVKEVLSSGRSVCIDDTRSVPWWADGAGADVERSWLGVPLLAAAETIGLCSLVKSEPAYFTPDRVHLVEAIHAPASVAVANARLYEEVRAGREQLKAVSRMVVEGQEGERLRVARELHDEVGQLLFSLILGLRRLENEALGPDEVHSHVREMKGVADAAQESLHRLASDLRPAALDHLGLVPALGQLAARLSDRGGPVVQIETLGFDRERLSPAVDIALYRIAQEALTNAIRHSGARRVSLLLERRKKSILMVVEDDGRGFAVETAYTSGRLGLPGIRERAEMLGGTLLVESSPGSGTTLVVEVPDAL